MALSLQDQLRKAGLVDDRKLRSARKEQRVEETRRRQSGAPSEAAPPAAQQRDGKAKRDREINRRRDEKLKARAVAAEIRQIVEAHRVPRDGGEVAFHFVVDRKIRKVYVTAPQREELVAGRLRIILGEHHELVPADIAERIVARDPRRVAPLRQSQADAPADPFYDRFVVPDDLDW